MIQRSNQGEAGEKKKKKKAITHPAHSAPSSKVRGRKSRPLRPKEWEQHKETIKTLFLDEDLPVKEVRQRLLSEHGFEASVRQYKAQLKSWRWKKNIRREEMAYMVRIQSKRRQEGKRTAFLVRGAAIPKEKIDRWLKRQTSPDSVDDTDSENDIDVSRLETDIKCFTPRDEATEDCLPNDEGPMREVSVSQIPRQDDESKLGDRTDLSLTGARELSPIFFTGGMSSDTRPSKKVKVTGRQSAFGCPYRKRNPLRFNIRNHLDCYIQKFETFQSLLEHIQQAHVLKPDGFSECLRCHARFSQASLLEKHLKVPADQMCDVSPEDPEDPAASSSSRDIEDGVTPEILDTVRMWETTADGSDSDMPGVWEGLWKVLFPDDEHSLSPDFEPPIAMEEVRVWLLATPSSSDLASNVRSAIQAMVPLQDALTWDQLERISSAAAIAVEQHITARLDWCKDHVESDLGQPHEFRGVSDSGFAQSTRQTQLRHDSGPKETRNYLTKELSELSEPFDSPFLPALGQTMNVIGPEHHHSTRVYPYSYPYIRPREIYGCKFQSPVPTELEGDRFSSNVSGDSAFESMNSDSDQLLHPFIGRARTWDTEDSDISPSSSLDCSLFPAQCIPSLSSPWNVSGADNFSLGLNLHFQDIGVKAEAKDKDAMYYDAWIGDPSLWTTAEQSRTER